jgi:class 3 adenylate cyclase/cell division protein FtsB
MTYSVRYNRKMQIHVVVPIIVGLLTILIAIITCTRFLAQQPLKNELITLQNQVRQYKEENKELTETNRTALQDIIRLRSGHTGVAIKREIEAELHLARDALGATESSVLAPDPRSYYKTFVFISIHGRSASQLHTTPLPISKGNAGAVYQTGEPLIYPQSKSVPKWFAGMDHKAGHSTKTMLTVPLRSGNSVVGVAQFLNKKNGQQFNEDDITIANITAKSIAPKVVEFISNPSNFELLGLTPEQRVQIAAILFCDLTASSTLIKTMGGPEPTIDRINEYLQRQSEIAFLRGAKVHNYLGDGMMLSFNAIRRVDDNDDELAIRSVDTALHMLNDFRQLKNSWIEFEFGDVSQIYSRMGIACGPVCTPVMGHPLFHHVTIFGEAVNRASKLCMSATRDTNVIVVDEYIHNRIQRHFRNEELPWRTDRAQGRAYQLPQSAVPITPPPEPFGRLFDRYSSALDS